MATLYVATRGAVQISATAALIRTAMAATTMSRTEENFT